MDSKQQNLEAVKNERDTKMKTLEQRVKEAERKDHKQIMIAGLEVGRTYHIRSTERKVTLSTGDYKIEKAFFGSYIMAVKVYIQEDCAFGNKRFFVVNGVTYPMEDFVFSYVENEDREFKCAQCLQLLDYSELNNQAEARQDWICHDCYEDIISELQSESQFFNRSNK